MCKMNEYFFDTVEVEKSNKFLVLIIYDIVDNKRRNKMAHYLEGFGFRVQKSAFEAILNKKIYEKLLKEIKGYEDKYSLDLVNYFNEHINMFNGDIKVVKFKADKRMLNYIWDTFGKVESIREDSGEPEKVIFRVRIAIEGAKAFARQFCDKCEILEPIELRNEMRDEFKGVVEKYK